MQTPHLTDVAAIAAIDLTGFRSGERREIERVAREIGAAARGIGFFSIVNHGIPGERIDAAFAEAHAFFALPAVEKMRVSVTHSKDYRGYVRIGEETLDPTKPPDIKECFNLGPDLSADDPDVVSGRPFAAVNQWPPSASFKATLNAYHAANLELVVAIHRAFAIDLGIEEEYFDARFARAVGVMRLLRYPPHPGTFDGTRYAAGANSDYGNLTLLAQDETRGLEVRARDGIWISVPPMRGAFVCNIGDCLMRWSNDVYVSTPHRVVNRSPRERFSIAFFGDPSADALVECLPACLAPGEVPKYSPITYGAYLRLRARSVARRLERDARAANGLDADRDFALCCQTSRDAPTGYTQLDFGGRLGCGQQRAVGPRDLGACRELRFGAPVLARPKRARRDTADGEHLRPSRRAIAREIRLLRAHRGIRDYGRRCGA